jgi:hypothetical protein
MLIAFPTKYGAGITLYGDYHDLSGIRDTIFSLTNRGPLIAHMEDFILALAYDLRHAYQGDREKREFGFDDLNKVNYFGVSVLWPTFLIQLGLLRWVAGFSPTTREEQSDLYRLESCAERALVSYDPLIGRKCFDWLISFNAFPNTYLIAYLSDLALEYISVGKPGKARFRNLPAILQMSSPSSTEYRLFDNELRNIATKAGCKPEELVDRSDWPEFKW